MSAVTTNRRSAILCIALFCVLCTVGSPRAAQGVELLMFEEPGCPWCKRWHAEVGPGYPLSPEGRLAPLRRLDLRSGAPAGIQLSRPVGASPTFVLIENGREIDRITGYPGADFFWGLLDQMLSKLHSGKSKAVSEPKNT